MLVLLHRHADAGTADPSLWPDDTRRPMSDRGRKIETKLARYLTEVGIVPTLVLASPWTRAWQTASLLVKAMELPVRAVECGPLAEPPDLRAITPYLDDRGPGDRVILIGHEPWLGQLASLLLTADPDRLRLDFPKSGVLAIEMGLFRAGAGELRFLVRPRMLP